MQLESCHYILCPGIKIERLKDEDSSFCYTTSWRCAWNPQTCQESLPI